MKVVTISMALEFRKVKNIEENLDYVKNLFEEIKNISPCFVVLPEVFAFAGLPCLYKNIKKEEIEKVKNFLVDIAKKTNCWIVGSTYDMEKDKIFNRCFFINRKGEIVGKYDKIHPTEDEMENGIYPGSKKQLPTDTEFGKIGAFICFDANWPENLKYQIDNGARLFVFSSAFPGGRILNSISLLYQIFIISGVWHLKSGIIDNTGRWIKRTDRFSYWVWADINIERTVFHWDYQGDKIKEIIRKYGDKVQIETFGDEALFTIETLDKNLSVSQIIKEFSLVTYKDYIKRAERKQNEKRSCLQE
ncbi:MAG: carbon-nitrogen hydrolase family protein [Candidatus Omnitrophica bacterium]|nr:carbon-nitrogen hydrolase family protein [Candidatus Omnitrophota bacterium]